MFTVSPIREAIVCTRYNTIIITEAASLTLNKAIGKPSVGVLSTKMTKTMKNEVEVCQTTEDGRSTDQAEECTKTRTKYNYNRFAFARMGVYINWCIRLRKYRKT